MVWAAQQMQSVPVKVKTEEPVMEVTRIKDGGREYRY
jgi:hypothetical protein